MTISLHTLQPAIAERSLPFPECRTLALFGKTEFLKNKILFFQKAPKFGTQEKQASVQRSIAQRRRRVYECEKCFKLKKNEEFGARVQNTRADLMLAARLYTRPNAAPPG